MRLPSRPPASFTRTTLSINLAMSSALSFLGPGLDILPGPQALGTRKLVRHAAAMTEERSMSQVYFGYCLSAFVRTPVLSVAYWLLERAG